MKREFIVPIDYIGDIPPDNVEIIRCEDCRFLIDHYGFMDDGYCANMRDEHCVKFKPDKDWFCADGKPKKGQ